MKTMRALGLALLAIVACKGGVVSPGETGSGGAGGTGGRANTGGSTTTGSGGAGPTGTGGSVGFSLACPKAELGSPALRLFTRSELETTLGDIFPSLKGKWTSALPANKLSAFGFDNDAATTVGKQQANAFIDTALSVATAFVGDDLGNLLPCGTSSADRACADQFLTKYGRRLFRRPLTQAERDRYLTFFDASKAKSDFKTALKWMVTGVIQSPSAIYRSEIGVAQSDSTRKLSAHEIATALAYTYTGSTPTETLLTQADSGDLGDVAAAAKNMVAMPEGKQALQRFFEGYLGYTGVSSFQRPNITNFSTLGADMVQETRAFIDDVVLQRGGGMKALLTATTTNPSTALANFYQFPKPASEYAQVTRPAGRGIGLLAQGSFLASHASPDSSSPTRRGLFPFLQLFCQTKPVLPDNVDQISSPQPGQKTTRQRYEELHAKPGTTCAACHRAFDPMGFAFEHFDEGGRYRETEGGLAIDASGTASVGAAMFSFKSQEEFAMQLANQPVVHQCLSAYLATYVFGTNEACLGSSQVTDLQAGSIGIAEAFARLAAEPHFTKRKSQ